MELVDPSLGSNYYEEEVMNMLSSVVSMLEGKIAVQAPTIKLDRMNPYMRFKAFEMLSLDSQSHASSFSRDSQFQGCISVETKDFSSSSRLLIQHQDLYNINLDLSTKI